MKNPGPGFGGFMIDDGCRCGRHENIPKYFDILLIIMLSQSILIRPLKSLIGVNNWRRCDTPVNVDVMSWMASICRTLVRVWEKYAIFCYFMSRREKWSFAVSDWNWWDCKLMFTYYDIRNQEMRDWATKRILLTWVSLQKLNPWMTVWSPIYHKSSKLPSKFDVVFDIVIFSELLVRSSTG